MTPPFLPITFCYQSTQHGLCCDMLIGLNRNERKGEEEDDDEEEEVKPSRLHRAENLLQRILLNFLFITAAGRMLAFLDCTDINVLESYRNNGQTSSDAPMQIARALLAVSSSSSSSSSTGMFSSSGMSNTSISDYMAVMVVEVVPTIKCWQGAHIFYAIMSLVTKLFASYYRSCSSIGVVQILVAGVFPAALASTIRINAEGSPTFFFMPRSVACSFW
jgi:hypothetical protein